MPVADPFEIGGQQIEAGTRKTIDLPVSVLSDHTPVGLSVHVVHGKEPGPVLFVSAAIHGDEVMGVEIVRRLLRLPDLENLHGTLLAVPVVNTFGFINHSRYLPDRRDLNRSFPGSEKGSLAARLARLFLNEIVKRSDIGIDLHSAAVHRTNLPQIRVSPSKPETVKLAEIFGAPIVLTSKIREGSLRDAAQKVGVDILLYEAGQGLRFDEYAARTGTAGILRVMHHLGMLTAEGIAAPEVKPLRSTSSDWKRAPAGGLLRLFKTVGDHVQTGDILGAVSDPFGEIEEDILADEAGLVIGRAELPVVNEGDAIFHIARIKKDGDDVESNLDSLATQLDSDPLFDEDEII
ncbi:succinylglutamate desuccinylase/aspartoacylase family protein [Parvularcula sp. IMCC14364]|uniref:succinylglutamate desuccinylase/aspartoacylase family protein n=1 Tax=Parvularcula sp. IMCC14364 TaxID=3067902 RepID=UPI0027415D7F|nr:succinylglutamate desuccinylase/aspartoacylase family protein [Parvularcula sp. IMCC14364]